MKGRVPILTFVMQRLKRLPNANKPPDSCPSRVIRRIECVDSTRPARRNVPATAAERPPRRANQVVALKMFQIEENAELDRRDPI